MKLSITSIFAIAALALAAKADEILDIPANEFVKDIKIGWNLGNTMDAECSSWLDYSVDQAASEVCWGNPRTTKELFTKLMETGFNAFRIPTTYSGHFGEAPDYKIADAWINRVQEIVDYAYSQGAYVIINLHHETWNDAFSNNLEKAKEISSALWTQIADKFKDYDEHVIFEGMNEVRKKGTPVEWNGGDQEGWTFVNEMNQLFVDTVRSSGGNNALRQLMVPTYGASVTDNAFGGYIFPQNDDKLIVSVHSYSPYNFALNNGEGATDKFTAPEEIDYNMKIINEKFRQNGIAVILGEFGAMNRNNDDQRKIWAQYYVNEARKIGVPCVWWDNGTFEGSGERFGIINRNTYEITYPDVITGLMAGANGEELPPVVTETTVVAPTTTIVTETTVVPTTTIVTETTVVPTTPVATETTTVVEPTNDPVIPTTTVVKTDSTLAPEPTATETEQSDEELEATLGNDEDSESDEEVEATLGNDEDSESEEEEERPQKPQRPHWHWW